MPRILTAARKVVHLADIVKAWQALIPEASSQHVVPLAVCHATLYVQVGDFCSRYALQTTYKQLLLDTLRENGLSGYIHEVRFVLPQDYPNSSNYENSSGK